MVPNRCESYFYAVKDKNHLTDYKTGDTIILKFPNYSRIRKSFRGKTVPFYILDHVETEWRVKQHWLELSTISNEILYVAPWDRFECLMIDLFPSNRRPYAGWKQKAPKIIKSINYGKYDIKQDK